RSERHQQDEDIGKPATRKGDEVGHFGNRNEEACQRGEMDEMGEREGEAEIAAVSPEPARCVRRGEGGKRACCKGEQEDQKGEPRRVAGEVEQAVCACSPEGEAERQKGGFCREDREEEPIGNGTCHLLHPLAWARSHTACMIYTNVARFIQAV